MRFLSVRDLRSKSAQVWRELLREKEMVITNNGRPIAVLSAVDGGTVEQSLTDWRRIRATRAITSIQENSMLKGTDGIKMDEIEAEIRKARRERGKRAR